MIMKIRPLRIGDRTIANILQSGVGTNFILICYTSLLSQGMSDLAWCVARVKQLKDLMYLEEQRKKVEEAKRLAREAEQQRRHEDPRTWEYHFAKAEEKNRHARVAELEGTTSDSWLPPCSERGNFPPSFSKFNNSF
jgi:glycyl-tRNA synthetase beta subunit